MEPRAGGLPLENPACRVIAGIDSSLGLSRQDFHGRSVSSQTSKEIILKVTLSPFDPAAIHGEVGWDVQQDEDVLGSPLHG